MGKVTGIFGLTPKRKSEAKEAQDKVTSDAVVVVRDDGKEVLVTKEQVENHLNRGFKLKNQKDAPKPKETKTSGFSDTTSAAKAKKSKK